MVDLAVEIGAVFGGPGDDQRGARLVDQNRVGLVDDREVELALHVVLQAELHVVAQVVEAELVVLPVGDVRVVRVLALLVRQVVQDAARRHAEELVDPPHPFRVAAGEVVVDGDHVHAAARERVQVGGQGSGQRLAFAGAHLGDAALVQEHAADHLHVVVALPQHAAARLAGERERFVEHVVERLAVLHLALEPGGLAHEVFVFERAHLRFELVDAHHLGQRLLELTVILGADDLLENPLDHVKPSLLKNTEPRGLANVEKTKRECGVLP